MSLVHFTVCKNVGNAMICVVSGLKTNHPVRIGICESLRWLPARLTSMPV